MAIYRKFTAETAAALVANGLLTPGGYLLTEHRLVVPAEKGHEVYAYLYKNGYISTSETKGEYAAMHING